MNRTKTPHTRPNFLSTLADKRALVVPLLAAVSLIATPEGLATADSKPRKPLGPIFHPEPADNEDYSLKPNRYSLFNAPMAQTVEKPKVAPGVEIRGFNVVIDKPALIKGMKLRRDEVAVISLYDTRYRGKDGLKSTARVQRHDGYYGTEFVDPVGRPIYDHGGMGDDASGEVSDRTILDNGLGTSDHEVIQVDKYRFKTKDDSYFKKMIQPRRGVLISRQTVPVKLKPNVECPDVVEDIISEVVLPGSVRHRVCNYLGKVSGIVPDKYKFYLDYARDEFGLNDHVDPHTKSMVSSLPYAKNIGKRSPAFGTKLHEAAHTVFESILNQVIKEKNFHIPAMYTLGRAYRGIVDTMTYRLPTYLEQAYKGYDVAANEPVWAAITESTYEKGTLGFKESYGGHPWDNRTEMASSALAVMSVYPEPFIRRYNGLTKRQQAAIKEAATVSLNMLANVTHTEQELEKFVPKYKIIMKALRINPERIFPTPPEVSSPPGPGIE